MTIEHPPRPEMSLVLKDARAGARERGLPVLSASFGTEPTVIFVSAQVGLGEALDVARAMNAPFISIDATEFSFEDFISEVSEENESAALEPEVKGYKKYDGELDGVYVRWVAAGESFLYMATPEWCDRIGELQGQQEERDRENRSRDVAAMWARRRELAEEIEALPAVRGIGTRGRKALATRLAGGLLKEDDDPGLVLGAVRDAVELAGVNAIGAYAEIESDLVVVARNLIETDGWQSVWRTPDRIAAAKAFLLSSTNGYAPTAALSEQLRRLAEDEARLKPKMPPRYLRLGTNTQPSS
ncbi:hypothetical protein [Cryobacterium sp. TMT4-31]|uniref:hypothetical protein n=1 Tax=Cryobacterium sp. TMT4-31 TaxID=1259259 RepID=UPI00106BB140|nr:hypothetical protein [Cryobacterium sp. TMT4-31]TFC87444.1 hypothetical protein E3T19_12475 [Cryobacterium sp. TMT4-31]